MTRRHSEPCPSEAAVRADLEPRDSHDLEEVFPRSQQADPPDVPVRPVELLACAICLCARRRLQQLQTLQSAMLCDADRFYLPS